MATSLRPRLRFVSEYGETVDSCSSASVDHALQDHRRVGAAETERIGQRNIDLPPARRLWHEVDRRLYRRVFQVDCRRGHLIANRENREDRLDRARRAQEMAR